MSDIHPSINFTQGKLKPWWFCEFAYHIPSHHGAHSHSGRLPRPATESQPGSTCFARRVAYKVTTKLRLAFAYMIEHAALFVLRTYVVPPYVSGSCAAMRNTSINLRSNVQKCANLSKHPPCFWTAVSAGGAEMSNKKSTKGKPPPYSPLSHPASTVSCPAHPMRSCTLRNTLKAETKAWST